MEIIRKGSRTDPGKWFGHGWLRLRGSIYFK